MDTKILIALDLEGVNNVVGEAYSGLEKGSAEWEKARREAAVEINALAEALFAEGATRVDVWDNHGGGGNIDFADFDKRIGFAFHDKTKPRMHFAGEYDSVFFFGYHTMEGTLGGVLAHTMSSKSVQYYKLNGKYVGEFDMDAYIAASHGTPCKFFCGGDLTCQQAKRAVPGILTVVTKQELSRNEAKFRDGNELLADIKKTGVEAARTAVPFKTLEFPATLEKSFKRVEDAVLYLEKMRGFGIESGYLPDEILGHDAHTVVCEVRDIDEFIKSIRY